MSERSEPKFSFSKRDYYEILGVERSATDQELKSAYRKLAMQYHPDRNPDNEQAEELFKELNEAYSVLSNSDSREKYNRFGFGKTGHYDRGDANNENIEFDQEEYNKYSNIISNYKIPGKRLFSYKPKAPKAADLADLFEAMEWFNKHPNALAGDPDSFIQLNYLRSHLIDWNFTQESYEKVRGLKNEENKEKDYEREEKVETAVDIQEIAGKFYPSKNGELTEKNGYDQLKLASGFLVGRKNGDVHILNAITGKVKFSGKFNAQISGRVMILTNSNSEQFVINPETENLPNPATSIEIPNNEYIIVNTKRGNYIVKNETGQIASRGIFETKIIYYKGKFYREDSQGNKVIIPVK